MRAKFGLSASLFAVVANQEWCVLNLSRSSEEFSSMGFECRE